MFDNLIHGNKPLKHSQNQQEALQPIVQHFHYPTMSSSTSSTSVSSGSELELPRPLPDGNTRLKSKQPPTPLCNIPPQNYAGEALMDFLTWAGAHFNDQRFIKAFDILKENDVTLDLFLSAMQDKDAEQQLINVMVTDCGFKPSFSLRITKACRTWGESLR